VSDFTAFLTARLAEDERELARDPPVGLGYACLSARIAREVLAKRAIIGEQTSDHAPIESIYGTTCRTCVTWQDAPLADGGETEFGIAIPENWPCRVARSAVAGYSDHPEFDKAWEL
jgi:hypothetical protein